VKLELITPPSSLPISLESVKSYLKVLDDLQDAEIELMIEANLAHAENITNQTLRGETTYKLTLECFPTEPLKLPKNPLITIEKIEYLDSDEEMTLLPEEKYNADNTTIPSTIEFLQVPPTTCVEITFVAGYEKLPKEVELWLKVKVLEEFDKLPESERSSYIDRLLDSMRIIPI